MFNPQFTVTQRLLANIKHIAILVAELNNKSFPDTILLEMEKTARAISSYSSTSIEGNPLPLTVVKQILKTKPENIRDTEQEVLNYNLALEKLNKLIQLKERHFGLNLILEIQKIVTYKLLHKVHCGKIRKDPVFVNDPRRGKTVYWPPDHQDVEQLLDELIKYTSKNERKIDHLILAGIFHKQFVIIHPFIDGNGRTVRLATKVLLSSMGLDTFNLFSFENYYNQNVSKYFEQVGLLGNYYDIKDYIDFTPWLEYFTDGIIDELLRVGEGLKKSAFSPADVLQPYHQNILNYIAEHEYITDKLYSQITDRAKATRNLARSVICE